jgi:bacteriorhodopsin
MAEQPRKVGVYDRVRETATHRRGGVPSWVWIVVALIILALVAWWVSRSSDTATIPTTRPAATQTTPAPAPQQPARQQ